MQYSFLKVFFFFFFFKKHTNPTAKTSTSICFGYRFMRHKTPSRLEFDFQAGGLELVLLGGGGRQGSKVKSTLGKKKLKRRLRKSKIIN